MFGKFSFLQQSLGELGADQRSLGLVMAKVSPLENWESRWPWCEVQDGEMREQGQKAREKPSNVSGEACLPQESYLTSFSCSESSFMSAFGSLSLT